MDFHAWHVWVVAGILLWIAEIFTPGFVFAIFGLGCFVSAVLAANDHTLTGQLLGFAISSLVLLFTARPFLLEYFHQKREAGTTNVDALPGRAGIVVEAIEPARDGGRVKVGGEEWKAVTGDRTPLEVGREVIVEKVEGCTVVVAPAPPEA